MRTVALNQMIDEIVHPLAKSRVLRFLENVRTGNETDYRSPLYGKDTPRLAILNSMEDAVHTDRLYPRLRALEASEREKVGPYSIVSPYEDRKDSVLAYFKSPTPASTTLNRDALTNAVNTLAKLVPKHSLRPISLKTVYDKSDKSTNWGLPFFGKGLVTGTLHLDLARQLLAKPGDYHLWQKHPSILGWRGQSRGLDMLPKQRVVWMFPHHIVLVELMYQQALINRLKYLEPFPAWLSMEHVDRGVTRLFRKAKDRGVALMSFDATAYDQSIRGELIDYVFEIIKFWFQVEHLHYVDQLQTFFRTSGIVVPDYIYDERSGSVPSGSGLTNLVDSLVQLILFLYVKGVLNEELDLTDCVVQGDDGVWLFNDNHNPEELSSIISELGIEANAAKQTYSLEYCMYLQRLYDMEGPKSKDGLTMLGVRSLYRTLSGMLSYSRMKRGWTSEMDSIRWLSQIENAQSHPQVGAFVGWAKLGDKYRLGSDYPGGIEAMFKKVGIDTAKSLLDQKTWKYGAEDLSNWREFSIMQYLD